jgi:hypothetical protein
MKTSTLRPGLLVSLKTSVTGNVAYKTFDLESEHLTPEGIKRARWETEKTVSDPEEHDRAIKVRSKARSLVTAICAQSDFGLLCPLERAGDLDSAFREARALADEFNDEARITRVQVFIIAGVVAQDDVEAVRAINSEVRGLLADMESGLQRLDVGAIREAANKARNLGSMLAPEAAERVQEAINAARSAARKIVKAAEEGAAEVDQATLRKLAEARTAFLDIDEGGEMVEPVAEARAIDLAPEPAHDPETATDAEAFAPPAAPAVRVPTIELDI